MKTGFLKCSAAACFPATNPAVCSQVCFCFFVFFFFPNKNIGLNQDLLRKAHSSFTDKSPELEASLCAFCMFKIGHRARTCYLATKRAGSLTCDSRQLEIPMSNGRCRKWGTHTAILRCSSRAGWSDLEHRKSSLSVMLEDPWLLPGGHTHSCLVKIHLVMYLKWARDFITCKLCLDGGWFE